MPEPIVQCIDDVKSQHAEPAKVADLAGPSELAVLDGHDPTREFEALHPYVQSRLLEIAELTNRMPFANNEARDKFVIFLCRKYFTQDPAEAWDESKEEPSPTYGDAADTLAPPQLEPTYTQNDILSEPTDPECEPPEHAL